MRFLAAALVITLAASLAAGLALRALARGYLRPRGRRSDRTPASLGLRGDPFAVAVPGGEIRGWIVRGERDDRGTVVFAHGWQSHAGDMLPWAAPVARAGYRAVVYDSLGHGESDPSEFTSLRHLRDDLLAVTRWVGDRAPGRGATALFGHSMGGAAAILAALESRAPAAVVLAGAPTDPLDIAREWMASRGLPGGLLVALMLPFWRRIVREEYASLRPLARIASLAVPVLVLHGTADRQVAVHHARALAEAAPRARLVLLEGGDHLTLHGHPRYERELLGFLEETLG